ncbi:MAG: lanthionine synthetase LanC family protein [Lactobacillaceae bacterium]
MNFNVDVSKISNKNQIFITNLLPSSYDSTEQNFISRSLNHYFLQFNFCNKKLPRQGFKIHVSAIWNNYKKILDIVYYFCKINKITFKYISNVDEVEKNLVGGDRPWESGKFITIYPSTYSDFKRMIQQLYSINILKDLDGIDILSDRRYKDSSNLFYRYGSISNTDKKIYNLDNYKEYYLDYKEPLYYLPSWISEPFSHNEDDEKNSKYLFKKYIPLRSLNNKASGSVFVIKKDNEKFILKNAKFGYADKFNSSIEQLKSEKRNLKLFSKYKYFPKYVDDFYEDHDYFLVETLISGESVNDFRADIINDFSNPNLFKDTLKKYIKVMINLISAVDTLHRDGIFIGDISAENILINRKDCAVYFIDIAQSGYLNEKQSFFSRTRGCFNEKIKYLTLENQDNQQLGYLLMSLFSRSNMFLKIDPTGNMSIKHFEKYVETYNIPKKVFYIIKELIEVSDIDLNKYTSMLQNMMNDSFEFIKVRPEKLNIKKLASQLNATIFSARIDGMLEGEDKAITINHNQDPIFSDNFLFDVECKYIKYGSIDVCNEDKKYFFNNAKKLSRIFLSRKIKDVKLENILSLIFCCINTIKNDDEINLIRCLLRQTISNYQFESGKTIGYKMKKDSSYLSPYLENGTSGVLLCLIAFKEKTNEHSFDEQIKELVNSQKSIFMPQNATFSKGLAGIIYSLLKCKEALKDLEIDNEIKIMLNRLSYYTIKLNGNTYIVNSNFDEVALDFQNGNLGVAEVLNRASRIY